MYWDMASIESCLYRNLSPSSQLSPHYLLTCSTNARAQKAVAGFLRVTGSFRMRSCAPVRGRKRPPKEGDCHYSAVRSEPRDLKGSESENCPARNCATRLLGREDKSYAAVGGHAVIRRRPAWCVARTDRHGSQRFGFGQFQVGVRDRFRRESCY